MIITIESRKANLKLAHGMRHDDDFIDFSNSRERDQVVFLLPITIKDWRAKSRLAPIVLLITSPYMYVRWCRCGRQKNIQKNSAVIRLACEVQACPYSISDTFAVRTMVQVWTAEKKSKRILFLEKGGKKHILYSAVHTCTIVRTKSFMHEKIVVENFMHENFIFMHEDFNARE